VSRQNDRSIEDRKNAYLSHSVDMEEPPFSDDKDSVVNIKHAKQNREKSGAASMNNLRKSLEQRTVDREKSSHTYGKNNRNLNISFSSSSSDFYYDTAKSKGRRANDVSEIISRKRKKSS